MKSNVRDLLEVAQTVYEDACAKCIAEVSDLRDLLTIRSRVEKEGISFLTITLPAFCDDFQQSLANGFIDPTFFRNFKKNGSIPAFLSGMIGLIFNRETGRLYEEQCTSIDCSIIIDSVRQICLTFKKIELACTPARVYAAIETFIKIEHDFSTFTLAPEDSAEFSAVSSVLWDNDVSIIDSLSLFPRHGPGATAERISGNQKYAWQYWHERLEPFFPLVDNAYSISAMGAEEVENVTFMDPAHEQPVRVVCVPKTLKGPRIIAIEPCCMQYAQQGVRRVLYDTLEASRHSKGHVNFRDQGVNQDLALSSSIDGLLATIDLSEASDRVPRDLAMEMFKSNPDLWELVDACRSTHAELPTGAVIGPLKKFASMGSALCFPVESMYFYTICVAALLRDRNLPLSHRNVFDVSRDIYVYGDDILVPTTNAITVLNYLQKYNCKINARKTFFSGNFRESCGEDAYLGQRVTPVYLRKERPKNRHQGSEVVSWVASANLFYLKGYWRTATLMYTALERILGRLPYVSNESSGLGRVSFMGYRSVERWNNKLHRFEVKAWSPRPVYRSDHIDGYPALAKSLVRLESRKAMVDLPDLIPDNDTSIQAVDALHLERSALHGAVVLQLRWVPST